MTLSKAANEEGAGPPTGEPDPDAYPVVFTQLSEEENGGWLVSFPDLPGCYAHGPTRPIALARGSEAVRVWINANRQRNIPVPQPAATTQSSGHVRIRVPRSLHARLGLLCSLLGESLNGTVSALLDEELSLLGRAVNGGLPDRRAAMVASLEKWKRYHNPKILLEWEYADHDRYSGEWVQRLDPRLHHALRYYADEQGVSMNALIVSLLALSVGRREAMLLADGGEPKTKSKGSAA
jgi:antitoxin HicB